MPAPSRDQLKWKNEKKEEAQAEKDLDRQLELGPLDTVMAGTRG